MLERTRFNCVVLSWICPQQVLTALGQVSTTADAGLPAASINEAISQVTPCRYDRSSAQYIAEPLAMCSHVSTGSHAASLRFNLIYRWCRLACGWTLTCWAWRQGELRHVRQGRPRATTEWLPRVRCSACASSSCSGGAGACSRVLRSLKC